MRALTGRTECFVAMAILLTTLACAGRSPSPPPPDPTQMARETYLIGVTDVLVVSVWKNPELSVEAPVRSDGMISVPLIDDVQAEGLTPQELKEVVTHELSEFVAAPDVTIVVKEVVTRELSEFVASPDVTIVVAQMNSRFVSVLGEVQQDGRIPLTRELRVLEAIAHVGGFSTFADRSDVRIVRRDGEGGEVEYRFDYNAYIRGKAPGTNIVLRPGDMIIVPD